MRSHQNNKLKNLLLVCLLLVSLTSLISAAPPVTTVQEFPEGYLIEESQHEYLKLNEDYQYNFFVFNASNGILITNESINCTFFLANASGNVLMMQPVEYYDMYWSVDLLGGNFSESGAHPYGVICQDDYGGALAGIFEVSPAGENLDSYHGFILIGLIGIIALFFGMGRVFDKKKWKLRMGFDILALITSIVLANSIKIMASSSISFNSMGSSLLILVITVVSLMVAYMLILMTIEVVQSFKKKNRERWEMSTDAY